MVFAVLFGQSAFAACWNSATFGPHSDYPPESCQNIGDYSSYGVAVYSCSNYLQLGGAYGCYWHEYICDGTCGGGSGGGGGGNNRVYSYGPNCGTNEIRSTTLVGTNLGGSCGHGRN